MKPKNIDFEALSLDELLELKDKVEARIEAVAQSEVEALKDRIAKLEPYVGSKNRKTKKSKAEKGEPSSPMKGKKVKPKFCDPETGKTWSGRGMMPVWLREYEEAGRKREDFAV